MRLIIAGSRHTALGLDLVFKGVRAADFVATEVVSGHSGDIDLAGEAWAALSGLPLRLFPYPSDQDLVDRGLNPKIPRPARGPIRNGWMAEYAAAGPPPGALLAVWDGRSRGTANMIAQARKRGLLVHVVRTDL